MSILVVVAHPDDEVLGCGAAIAAATSAGVRVQACILSAGAEARRHRPGSAHLRDDTLAANESLGMQPPILGVFPNIALNTVPHLDLVQFIEEALITARADTIVTHHPCDLNNDHLHVSRAANAAARLWLRRDDVVPLHALYHMEVLSSTDWAFTGRESTFAPNTFVEVTEAHIERKIHALRQYRGVMRSAPHSRSEETVRALARVRGSQGGYAFAEAFECRYQRTTLHADTRAGLPR